MFKRRKEASDKNHEELFIKILTFFSGGERYFTPDMKLNDVITEEFDEWLFEFIRLIIDMILLEKEMEERDEGPGTGYIIWVPQDEISKGLI